MVINVRILPLPTPIVQRITGPAILGTAKGGFVFQKQLLLSIERAEDVPPFRAVQVRQRSQSRSMKHAPSQVGLHDYAFRARTHSTNVPLPRQGSHWSTPRSAVAFWFHPGRAFSVPLRLRIFGWLYAHKCSTYRW